MRKSTLVWLSTIERQASPSCRHRSCRLVEAGHAQHSARAHSTLSMCKYTSCRPVTGRLNPPAACCTSPDTCTNHRQPPPIRCRQPPDTILDSLTHHQPVCCCQLFSITSTSPTPTHLPSPSHPRLPHRHRPTTSPIPRITDLPSASISPSPPNNSPIRHR